MKFDLIIFDCDGTLVDSEYLNNQAVVDLLESEGLTGYDLEYSLNTFVGMRFSHIIDAIAKEKDHKFSPDISKKFIAHVRALIPTHMNRIDGALRLVKYLSEQGTKICVASNGERTNVEYSLEIADLLPYFGSDHVFTGLDVKHPKPAPDLFLLAAEKMGADPAKCLVMEDSLVGVKAGKAANMTTWGFSGAHQHPEDHARKLEEAGADAAFTSLIHIQELLEGKSSSQP